MAKESILGRLEADAIRWIHAKTESWNGIDDQPYTGQFESAYADFLVQFKVTLSLNSFWRAFVAVRKLPKPKKAQFGLTPSSERKKHQRYVRPVPRATKGKKA